jgi:hypothetical protein
MRAVEWLWPSRFAIGKLGLIGGLPDKGKGLICSSIIEDALTVYHATGLGDEMITPPPPWQLSHARG